MPRPKWFRISRFVLIGKMIKRNERCILDSKTWIRRGLDFNQLEWWHGFGLRIAIWSGMSHGLPSPAVVPFWTLCCVFPFLDFQDTRFRCLRPFVLSVTALEQDIMKKLIGVHGSLERFPHRTWWAFFCVSLGTGYFTKGTISLVHNVPVHIDLFMIVTIWIDHWKGSHMGFSSQWLQFLVFQNCKSGCRPVFSLTTSFFSDWGCWGTNPTGFRVKICKKVGRSTG